MQEKIKKPWSAKKILIIFLVIGIIVTSIMCIAQIIDEIIDFNNECEFYSAHVHDQYCGEVCDYVDPVEEYGTGFKYAFREDNIGFYIFSLLFCLACSEMLALIILLIKRILSGKKDKIESNEKTKTKFKETKIDKIKNILD